MGEDRVMCESAWPATQCPSNILPQGPPCSAHTAWLSYGHWKAGSRCCDDRHAHLDAHKAASFRLCPQLWHELQDWHDKRPYVVAHALNHQVHQVESRRVTVELRRTLQLEQGGRELRPECVNEDQSVRTLTRVPSRNGQMPPIEQRHSLQG